MNKWIYAWMYSTIQELCLIMLFIYINNLFTTKRWLSMDWILYSHMYGMNDDVVIVIIVIVVVIVVEQNSHQFTIECWELNFIGKQVKFITIINGMLLLSVTLRIPIKHTHTITHTITHTQNTYTTTHTCSHTPLWLWLFWPIKHWWSKITTKTSAIQTILIISDYNNVIHTFPSYIHT